MASVTFKVTVFFYRFYTFSKTWCDNCRRGEWVKGKHEIRT